MNIKKLFSTFALGLCAMSSQIAEAQIVMISPQDYQIFAVSPNGKWACGTYSDFSYINHAFRWNLESGEIELLDTRYESEAWSVANDGTVSGTYKESNTTGAALELPGYYKDGAWQQLEMPFEGVSSGMGYGITPDGHYMSGSIEVNGKYLPIIWKDGKVSRILSDQYTGMPYTIAPDGQSAAGWTYTATSYNRNACYWAPGTTEPLILSYYASPWSAVWKISPDGKKMVLWGGWDKFSPDQEEDPTDWSTLLAIYDIETGTKTSIPTIVENAAFDLYDISNNGTVVGSESNMAYIYVNGQGHYAEEYLRSKGVDFSGIPIYKVAASEGGDSTLMLYRTQAISANDSVIALTYYDDEGAYRAMVVKFGTENTYPAPVEVSASQLSGIPTACIAWKAPMGVNGLKGYNVYRNGTKLNDTPISGLSYYDNGLEYTKYTYVVATVYENGNEVTADAVEVTVEPQKLSAPQALFVRQKGANGAYLQWAEPMSNLITKKYYDLESISKESFGTNQTSFAFEIAQKYDKDEIACYADNKIKQVAFYPMSEQESWTINLYTRDAAGTLTRFYTQPVTQWLKYGERNAVKLDVPQSIPDGDLIVGIAVVTGNGSSDMLGMDYGRCKEGYSDLLRISTEPDFYSIYASSVSSGYPYFATWLIDVVLAPEGTGFEGDVVKHYTVYSDGVSLGETNSTHYDISSLSDGSHKLAVDATYDAGKSEAKEVVLNVASKYPGVDYVHIKAEGDTKLYSYWAAPVDDDDTWVSYSTGKAAHGIYGPESNNYGYMAGVVYPSSMLKGYNKYEITSFSFYPTADALFTFNLLDGNNILLELEVDNYVLNSWNEVKLPSPISINELSTYTLALDCYDVTANEAPLAIDDAPSHMYYSDLYSLDGESWDSFYSTGVNGNWMMGWNMRSPAGQPMTVTGYDVLIDGVKKNDTMLAAPEFRYDFGTKDGALHNLTVNTYFPGRDVPVAGEDNYFTIGVDAIDNAKVEVLNLTGNSNFLRAEGEGVKSMEAYNMAGAVVASADGNTLNISSLATGIYVVRIDVAGKSVTRKIEIRK